MPFFKRKQRGYIGVDFGAAGIKVVQLEAVGDRGKLFTYGFTELSVEEIGGDYLARPEETAALLKKVCQKARVTTTQAVGALPIPTVFSAVLSLAAVPKKELQQVIEWEAKKLIPLPLEEVTLDFRELKFSEDKKKDQENKAVKEKGGKDKEKEGQAIEVLLTAAPKGIIDKYIAIAKMAGFTLTALETEAFALIRALIGTDPTPTVIVDVGALRSNILIVDRSIPMLTRSVEIGGKKCTEAIAASLGLNLLQAEALKRDMSMGLSRSASGVPEILKEVLQPLLNELKYSFNVYRARNSIARPPERLMLTGGGAEIQGFSELLATEFNLRAFLGNPWERVTFHPDLRALVDSLGSRFAVAIGLALRNI